MHDKIPTMGTRIGNRSLIKHQIMPILTPDIGKSLKGIEKPPLVMAHIAVLGLGN